MLQTDLPRRMRRNLLVALLGALVGVLPAAAQELAPTPEPEAPPVLDGKFASAIVVDADTGWILVAKNERKRRQPASMLKMMTELLILENVADGDLKLDEEITVSAKASRMGGSQVYLAHNEVFQVEELLQALAIHSANDAACALAEHMAGSTDAFADLMNLRAKELGMTDTDFHSVHGLPAGRGQGTDLTSARDMAILGRELVGHPEALRWASTATAPFRGGEFTLYNPNKLVGKFRGLDGIKTGFTQAAGFCVTASAVQRGKRLISVVMGCPTDHDRANETTRLLSYAFNLYEQVPAVAAAGEPLAETLKIKDGKRRDAPVGAAAVLNVSVPRHRAGEMVVDYRLPESMAAPLAAGTEVGSAVAVLDGVELGSVPLVLLADVPRGNWLDRLFH